MNIYFDLEANGFVETATKIHCACFMDEDEEWTTAGTLERHKVEKFFRWMEEEGHVLVGHNIIKYDLPLMEKIWDVHYFGNYIDTLVLSKLFFPDRKRHSLGYLMEQATGETKLIVTGKHRPRS